MSVHQPPARATYTAHSTKLAGNLLCQKRRYQALHFALLMPCFYCISSGAGEALHRYFFNNIFQG
ncbi:MAG: hypothetical protein KJ961_16055, partial [Alphaproteobacteria bacterium]|nr:hypothetical protein [Alphaproteobacteria bacterium]